MAPDSIVKRPKSRDEFNIEPHHSNRVSPETHRKSVIFHPPFNPAFKFTGIFPIIYCCCFSVRKLHFRAVLCIWLVVLVTALPVAMFHDERVYWFEGERNSVCVFQTEKGYNRYHFHLSFFLTSAIIPLSLISILYVGMLVRLWRGAPGCRISAESRWVNQFDYVAAAAAIRTFSLSRFGLFRSECLLASSFHTPSGINKVVDVIMCLLIHSLPSTFSVFIPGGESGAWLVLLWSSSWSLPSAGAPFRCINIVQWMN